MGSPVITGIVLAGGKSSRMGTDKALLRYNNVSLLQNAIGILQHVCDKVVISAPLGKYNLSGYECWPDELQVNSAMTGIYSCLNRSETQLNIVLSCDMPLVRPEFLEELLRAFSDCEAVVPSHDDGCIEPLCAIYGKSVLSSLRERMRVKAYKLNEWALSTRHILFQAEKSSYYLPGMFININSSEDFDLLVNS